MSGKVTGLVLEADLPKDEKAVLTALADHAQHDGTRVYPSTDKLIWMTGYTRRSVQYALDKLEAKGILVCVQRGGKGRHTPTAWRIALESLPALPPFEEWRAKQERHDHKGAMVAPLADDSAEDAESLGVQGAAIAPLEPQGATIAPLADTDEPKGAIHDSLGRNPRQLRAQSTTRKGAMVAPDPEYDPSFDPSGIRTRARARTPEPPERESRTAEAEAEAASAPVPQPQFVHAYRTIPVSAPPALPTTIGATERADVWRRVTQGVGGGLLGAIHHNFFSQARLFAAPDSSWLLLAHSPTALEVLSRFEDAIRRELLLQTRARAPVTLSLRTIAEVRADEEALV